MARNIVDPHSGEGKLYKGGGRKKDRKLSTLTNPCPEYRPPKEYFEGITEEQKAWYEEELLRRRNKGRYVAPAHKPKSHIERCPQCTRAIKSNKMRKKHFDYCKLKAIKS